jgi:hypothetical protein
MPGTGVALCVEYRPPSLLPIPSFGPTRAAWPSPISRSSPAKHPDYGETVVDPLPAVRRRVVTVPPARAAALELVVRHLISCSESTIGHRARRVSVREALCQCGARGGCSAQCHAEAT